VPPPAALVGAANPGYDSGLNVTVTARGATATAVRLTDTITVHGGRHPGVYAVVVTDVIHNGRLVIASWEMHRS